MEIRSDRRIGIPYPEWNIWTKTFLPDHVAVLERKHPSRSRPSRPMSADLRRWFEEHTHRVMKNRLEDGSDLDLAQYVEHYVDTVTGEASEARVFRDLLPGSRDVTTALLLDGSSSLGAHQGRIFQLELACADALSRAMAHARERHGLFAFSGNTRHRVEVTCLKDFEDPHFVVPSGLGLATGGYTRLGAPMRHLTSRLLAQASERRLLIMIGDGLISDEGYEGRYAWADAAHAVEEASEAGVAVYYVGVGRTRVDPLPDVFGPRRSTRITQVEELPRALARVHRELVAS
jgi:nitric oxide reductase activation protein